MSRAKGRQVHKHGGGQPVLAIEDEAQHFQETGELAPVIVHNVTPDGRLMHYMTKVNGVWSCDCGETR